jgi:hypothetical protein
LTQESLFSDLGITDDGGNFSCGVGQINVLEWCRWANKQSVETKARLGWANDATCEGLTTESLRPFHELATQNMQGLPGYRLSREHFKNITFNDVQNKVPGANLVQKKKNYALIQSFIGNCGKPLYGIDAKAHELASLFRNHVPAGIKNREVYPAGKKFEQNCKYRDQSGVYPLHTGWLMAVAAYNAGPRATETVSHYYDLTRADLADVKQMSFLNPVRLVEGLFMGGKFNAVTGRIDFTTSAGLDTSNPAFKQCVMHQHVVRIVQHVTKAGVPPLVKTLNEIEGCSAANPLPESRLRSSGRL